MLELGGAHWPTSPLVGTSAELMQLGHDLPADIATYALDTDVE